MVAASAVAFVTNNKKLRQHTHDVYRATRLFGPSSFVLLLAMAFDEPAAPRTWLVVGLGTLTMFIMLLVFQICCSRYRRRMRRQRLHGRGYKSVRSRSTRRSRASLGTCITAVIRVVVPNLLVRYVSVVCSSNQDEDEDAGAGGRGSVERGAGGRYSRQQRLDQAEDYEYERIGDGTPEHRNPVVDWTPERVRDWVEDLQLAHVPRQEILQYAEQFLHQRVSGYTLQVGKRDAMDVSRVGIPLGPSILIAERIKELLESSVLDEAAIDGDGYNNNDNSRYNDDVEDGDSSNEETFLSASGAGFGKADHGDCKEGNQMINLTNSCDGDADGFGIIRNATIYHHQQRAIEMTEPRPPGTAPP